VDGAELEQRLVDAEHRLTAVEQILPTLLTRAEFKIAMAALDRQFGAVDRRFDQIVRRFERADAAAAKRAEELKHHFDVLTESLRSDIRIIAEGHVSLASRLEQVESRADRLENSPSVPPRQPSARLRRKSR